MSLILWKWFLTYHTGRRCISKSRQRMRFKPSPQKHNEIPFQLYFVLRFAEHFYELLTYFLVSSFFWTHCYKKLLIMIVCTFKSWQLLMSLPKFQFKNMKLMLWKKSSYSLHPLYPMDWSSFQFSTIFLKLWVNWSLGTSPLWYFNVTKSALSSKNAVCAIIKHSRYFHLKSSFRSINSQTKML